MGTTPDACDWFAIGARGNLKAVTSACQLMAGNVISQASPAAVTRVDPPAQSLTAIGCVRN